MSSIALKGKYKLIDEIGRGGFGTVFLASDLKVPGQFWAVKALRNLLSDRQEAQRVRELFDKEQKILSWLDHPAIVRRHEVLVDGSTVYLVMECVDGQDLRQIMSKRQRGLSAALTMSFAEQICDILSYLHTQKPHPIIFRDLKPSNLMVTQQGRIKLVDFGIARLARMTGDPASSAKPALEENAPLTTPPPANWKSSEDITEELDAESIQLAHRLFGASDQDTTIYGTPGYAAPEQYGRSGLQTDCRADLYSLGAIMFHLLTLENPASFSLPLPALHRYLAGASERIEELILKATAVDREQRFRTTRAMMVAIQAAKPRVEARLLSDEVRAIVGKSHLARYQTATGQSQTAVQAKDVQTESDQPVSWTRRLNRLWDQLFK
jgi:serine/threonine protein kinase, bacterial